ncbi:MAG TPA: 2OG-Fe(II) oxygenase [Longimicrobium sp.]|jgi:SM-20-related protein|uniref:2OG-Fe(II) oxygenase n=1 Tax=Longimicrobium sp. TaxID=2029185 RepID=UPI002ED9EB11
MIDLYEIDDFLDPAARAELVAELDGIAGAPATVLSQQPGGMAMPSVRKSTRLSVSPETRERVRNALLSRSAEIGAHFGVDIKECEDPQFLRYEEGDYFVAHQDGNTPMLHDDSRFRRISAVLFLSNRSEEPAPGTYGGGSLVFHGPYSGPMLRVAAEGRPGSLVTFRAETTHEVLPVTHGVRYTVAAWFR